jgi:nickel/cobalt exporter
VDLVTERRPQLGVLLILAIAGGLLPDPSALAILLAALSTGRVLLGLATVVEVGQRILDWLSSMLLHRVTEPRP